MPSTRPLRFELPTLEMIIIDAMTVKPDASPCIARAVQSAVAPSATPNPSVARANTTFAITSVQRGPIRPHSRLPGIAATKLKRGYEANSQPVSTFDNAKALA